MDNPQVREHVATFRDILAGQLTSNGLAGCPRHDPDNDLQGCRDVSRPDTEHTFEDLQMNLSITLMIYSIFLKYQFLNLTHFHFHKVFILLAGLRHLLQFKHDAVAANKI